MAAALVPLPDPSSRPVLCLTWKQQASIVESMLGMDDSAAQAAATERSLGLWQNLKLYPKAAGWSILLSTTIIMEGFDIVLIANLLAVPAFQERFGEPLGDGTYQLTAAWQAGLTNGALVGEILGLMVCGIIADRFGFRSTMIGALGFVTCFIFIVFFVQSLPQLLVGLILLGLPWGAFQTLTATYASEVCPVGLRPYLTTYVRDPTTLNQSSC